MLNDLSAKRFKNIKLLLLHHLMHNYVLYVVKNYLILFRYAKINVLLAKGCIVNFRFYLGNFRLINFRFMTVMIILFLKKNYLH